jgi:hypothetical protein
MALFPCAPAWPLPPAHQGTDELGGIAAASAGAQPDDDFSEADLLAGNAGLDPGELHEPETPPGPAR